jgi:hypothetical protein
VQSSASMSASASASSPALSEMDKIRFLQRLRQLQNLCSGTHPSYPRALLCVPGPDGRGNKGSLMILKYLFQFSCGKDLFEGNMEDRYESLEEMVMLIQDNCVSVIVTVEAKLALAPFLPVFPLVVVYSSADDRTEEVDEFQARKAGTFKKLMLQSVAQGEVVGMPVPLGYDSVLDVENWSLLRAFALETVVLGTGFFTARYTVIDVTEALEILFRSVDSTVISKVIEVIKTSIVPNVHQSLRILSGRGAVENRLKLTAEDVTSPLDFLFDFGELETVFPPDPLLKPMALFAQLSNTIGNMPDHVRLAAAWKGVSMPAGCVHVVVEGSEPSTGVRWCRTYFTRRGRQVTIIKDPDSLVSSGASEDEAPTPGVAADVARLETLYTLLWEGLRGAVREVFGGIETGGMLAPSSDVVSAGALIEERVDAFMKARLAGGLAPGEALRIHMDCMNGLGQQCRAEEVDDIGGQCLAFVRVSVHGIETSGLSQPVAVAVGDTFLFSPHCSQVRTLLCSAAASAPAGVSSSYLMHLQDPFCLTHAVPYMHGIFGVGIEDAAAQRLVHAAAGRSLQSLAGLGEPIEAHGSSSAYTFPLLTDHASCPYFQQAELAFFEGGFMSTRLNGATLPGIVSFDTHVAEMWAVDMQDVFSAAQALHGGATTHWVDLPDGLVVIMRLKEGGDSHGREEAKGGESASGYQNPFDSFLPENSRVQHVAFVVRSDIASSSAYYTRTANAWKRAIRTNDIPEHRGRGGAHSPALPPGILLSFLALYDYWGAMGGSGAAGTQDLMSAANIPRNLCDEDKELAVEDVFVSASGPMTTPGAGFLPLKSLFMICENARVYTAEAEMIKSAPGLEAAPLPRPAKATGAVSVVVVLGHAGSTALEVATALLPRLPATARHVVADCSDLAISVPPADSPAASGGDGVRLGALAADIGGRLQAASAQGESGARCVLLSLVLSPGMVPDLPLFLDHCVARASADSSLAFNIKFVISTVASYQLSNCSVPSGEMITEDDHFRNNRWVGTLADVCVCVLHRVLHRLLHCLLV